MSNFGASMGVKRAVGLANQKYTSSENSHISILRENVSSLIIVNLGNTQVAAKSDEPNFTLLQNL